MAKLDGRTLASRFSVGAATFIMNARGALASTAGVMVPPCWAADKSYGACSLSNCASHRGSSARTESRASHSWGGSARRSDGRAAEA